MISEQTVVAQRVQAVAALFDLGGTPGLARIFGVSQQAVRNWVYGDCYPKAEDAIKLCDLTGVSLDWIYGGTVRSMAPEMMAKLNAYVASGAARPKKRGDK